MNKLGEQREEDSADPVPKVSVSTVTYMHEAFIADTIEGVLMQDVDFPIEYVVGEDCSPDGTRDIILGYMEKHPGLIRLSDYERNMGAGKNFRTTLGRCRGEYIALLDGDDYWTSPHKLRKQVELMDAHPEFSVCFHAVSYKYEDGRRPPWPVYPPGRRSTYCLADLAKWMRIGPSSMLLRRSALPAFPSWHNEVFFGDWALQVILAERGDIGYIDEVMGVKRLQSGSILFGQGPRQSRHIENIANQCEVFHKHLGEVRGLPFARERDRCRYRLVHAYLDEGNPEKAREVFRATRGACGFDPRVALREPMLTFMHFYIPFLYRALRVLWQNTWHRTAWHRGLQLWDAD